MSTPTPMAFPNSYNTHSGGMELRDWFAGQALSGVIAADTDNEVPCEDAAECAYKLADAMMEARKK